MRLIVTKFIQSIDEDGSLELENGELLFFVQQNDLIEYFKKYEIKNQEKKEEDKSDKVELDYEDLTNTSPDLSDENLDLFKVSIDDKKIKKQSLSTKESIFEEKENIKPLPIIDEENEESSNNMKKIMKKK